MSKGKSRIYFKSNNNEFASRTLYREWRLRGNKLPVKSPFIVSISKMFLLMASWNGSFPWATLSPILLEYEVHWVLFIVRYLRTFTLVLSKSLERMKSMNRFDKIDKMG